MIQQSCLFFDTSTPSVIAGPSTEAQAATGIAKSKTYYAGLTKTLKLTTSSKWKNVKTTWSTSNKSIVKIAKKTNKTVTINCVKAGKANVTATLSGEASSGSLKVIVYDTK